MNHNKVPALSQVIMSYTGLPLAAVAMPLVMLQERERARGRGRQRLACVSEAEGGAQRVEL